MQALKWLVILMGALIVAGVTVLGVTVFQRAQRLAGKDAAPPPAARPAPLRGFDAARLALPEGGRIVEMTAEGERLILRLRLGDGAERLVFIDMGSGAKVGELSLERAE